MFCGYFDNKALGQWLKVRGVPLVVIDRIFKKSDRVSYDDIYSWDDQKLKELNISEEDRKTCIEQWRRLPTSKVFQDPIYGPIELHPLLVKIVDTPQFQRLRDIKQLGGVYYVYPGASHNRFEHSIGVCYLAGKFIENLCLRQPGLGIDRCDILCVLIAALCHDMGHGPFSHLYQDLFIPKFHRQRKWKHEEASIKLLDYMMEVNEGIHEIFQLFGLDWERDGCFIKELIYGCPLKEGESFKGRAIDKHFLYEIVANKVNEVDVDKMDYLRRDSHGLGITVDFDWRRYIEFARVIKDKDGCPHICPRNKVVRDVYELFNIRDRLFRAAYQHKTKRAIELMFLDAMIKANDHIEIQGKDGCVKKMSEAIDDMEAFTKLTDAVIYSIAFLPNPELTQAKQILSNIQQRKLYMCIGKSFPCDEVFQSPLDELARGIVLETKQLFDSSLVAWKLDEKKIKIEVVPFTYGSDESNPVDKVWFYFKETPNEPRKIEREQVSSFLPNNFKEQEYRVYYMEYNPAACEFLKKGFRNYCKTNTKTFVGQDKLSPPTSGTSSPKDNSLRPFQ